MDALDPVPRLDLDKEAFRKFVHKALKASGTPAGKAFNAFVGCHFGEGDSKLISSSGFRNWMRGDNVTYDIRLIYILANLQQKTMVEAIAEICGTTIAHLTGTEEGDQRPKLDMVHLQEAIGFHQKLGEILSAMLPVPQVVNSGLPNHEAVGDTEIPTVSNATSLSMCAPKLSVYLNRVLLSRGDSSSIRDFVQYADNDYALLIEQAIAGTVPEIAINDPDFLYQLAECVAGYAGRPCNAAMIQAEIQNPPDAPCSAEGFNGPSISAMN